MTERGQQQGRADVLGRHSPLIGLSSRVKIDMKMRPRMSWIIGEFIVPAPRSALIPILAAYALASRPARTTRRLYDRRVALHDALQREYLARLAE